MLPRCGTRGNGAGVRRSEPDCDAPAREGHDSAERWCTLQHTRQGPLEIAVLAAHVAEHLDQAARAGGVARSSDREDSGKESTERR